MDSVVDPSSTTSGNRVATIVTRRAPRSAVRARTTKLEAGAAPRHPRWIEATNLSSWMAGWSAKAGARNPRKTRDRARPEEIKAVNDSDRASFIKFAHGFA